MGRGIARAVVDVCWRVCGPTYTSVGSCAWRRWHWQDSLSTIGKIVNVGRSPVLCAGQWCSDALGDAALQRCSGPAVQRMRRLESGMELQCSASSAGGNAGLALGHWAIELCVGSVGNVGSVSGSGASSRRAGQRRGVRSGCAYSGRWTLYGWLQTGCTARQAQLPTARKEWVGSELTSELRRGCRAATVAALVDSAVLPR